jgi:hypothetical protein
MPTLSWATNVRTTLIITIVVALLFGCGEPFREEGQLYGKVANNAINEYRLKSGITAPIERPYWNDCGQEVTCLFLYNTKDQQLFETIVASLVTVQAKIKHPGIKLTVYSTSHDEPKVIFHEVTIK